MIKIGNTKIVRIYLGTVPVISLYKGTDKVFEGSTSKE